MNGSYKKLRAFRVLDLVWKEGTEKDMDATEFISGRRLGCSRESRRRYGGTYWGL